MIAFTIILSVIILVFAAIMIFDRWCIHKEEMFRMEAQLEEIRCCYDSEQSFLTLEDDPEHIDSITPEVEVQERYSAEERYGER